MPDFKTIADFRKDNGEAIRRVCREFVVLCRRLELFSEASVAIDGSKFKAVNTRDRNFTQAKMQRRLAQIDESIARYLSRLDSADRQGEAVPEAKITRLNEKIAALRQEIQRLNALDSEMMQTEDRQISLTDPDARSMATSGRGSGMVGYNVQSAVDTQSGWPRNSSPSTLTTACWAFRPGRYAYCSGGRLASKIGSSTSIVAVMQTRSCTIEIPSGLSLPLAFGMNTLLIGSGW
jgi:hypothetical protein